jgi:hypothetical protein
MVTASEAIIEVAAVAGVDVPILTPIGLPGPAGASGGGGSAYTHTQSTPATTWTINHNLGFRPDISLRTVGNVEFEGDITHTTINQSVVSLSVATAGSARCT